MAKLAVEMTDIVKRFGEVTAISNGRFELREGEIHSLIGENGTGKSTMMKLLFGMYPVTEGTIKIYGKNYPGLSTKEAIELGIGMVHQDFMLINDLTVLENIILGSEPSKGWNIDFEKAESEIQYFIDQYKLNINLHKKINDISVGEAQRVEIVKVLSKGANIIILDEPTAVLTPQEAESLFEIVMQLKKDGKTVVFISHKMDEVLSISDRITVMRKGKYVDSINVEEATYSVLSKLMIGREVFLDSKKTNVKQESEEVIFQANDIWIPGDNELSKLRGVDLSVKKGEILGVAGIDGNGQLELEEAISGLREVEKGNIYIDGVDITNKTPKNIRKSGLSYIPSDRNKRGLNRSMTIEYNLISTHLDESRFAKRGVLQSEDITSHAEKMITDYDIRPNNPKELASAQSGGNAQKDIVAREVSTKAKLLVASHPTRGVDIGAIESIRSIIQEKSDRGTGVLLISADLGEILSLSDRIVVIYEGKIVADLPSSDANEENLGMYMMGGTDDYIQE